MNARAILIKSHLVEMWLDYESHDFHENLWYAHIILFQMTILMNPVFVTWNDSIYSKIDWWQRPNFIYTSNRWDTDVI